MNMLNLLHDTAGDNVIRPDTQSATAPQPYSLEDLNALKVTTGAISPEMAKHMRDTMHFERQRAIRDKNVDRLAEEMRRGWFLAGTPIYICVLPDGRQQIVNGNHTLEAVTASGVTIPLTIIRKYVWTMEDVARAYATFDIHQARSWMDTITAQGRFDDVPNLKYVIPALSIIQTGFRSPSSVNDAMVRSRQARIDLLPEYLGAARALHALSLEAPNGKILRRAAFFSVALYTMRYQPSAAEEFWGGLMRDDGLAKSDPRKALLRFWINSESGAGSSQRVIHSKGAMLAWNAAFEGRTLEVCKTTAMLHIRIAGTPLHKGHADGQD